jgi:hypothetical protein
MAFDSFSKKQIAGQDCLEVSAVPMCRAPACVKKAESEFAG